MTGEPDSGYARLEDQIGWYDKKSQSNQQWYKWLKGIEIIAAAAVPVVAGIDAIVTAVLGVVVVVLEGVQHLNQFHNNWVAYRTTCEALRREKYLFLAKTGPYDALSDNGALKELAGRVEALISTENTKWITSRNEPRKEKDKNAD